MNNEGVLIKGGDGRQGRLLRGNDIKMRLKKKEVRLKDEQELEKCQGGECVGEHCTPGDGAASRKSRPLVRAAV